MLKDLVGSTRLKMRVARLVYPVLRLLCHEIHVVCRSGVRFLLEASEAIDLSVRILGTFQNHVVESTSRFWIPRNAIVLDVGANSGVLSLMYARLFDDGHVFSFEPTDRAYSKLKANLLLNPTLARRITPVHCFLGDRSHQSGNASAFARWRLDVSSTGAHPHHCGSLSPAAAPAASIDDFVKQRGLERIDLIKIDTDGAEYEVLRGATTTLKRFHPILVLEVCPYILEERGLSFGHFEDLLASVRYVFLDPKTRRPLPRGQVSDRVPFYGSTDFIAVPRSRKARIEEGASRVAASA